LLSNDGQAVNLNLRKIDSRLGGPRFDAKEAPEQETLRQAESHFASAGFGPS
jgi:hypothetical protein